MIEVMGGETILYLLIRHHGDNGRVRREVGGWAWLVIGMRSTPRGEIKRSAIQLAQITC